MPEMSDREIQIRKRLRDDLPHYAEKCLKIRVKKAVVVDGRSKKIIPFVLMGVFGLIQFPTNCLVIFIYSITLLYALLWVSGLCYGC